MAMKLYVQRNREGSPVYSGEELSREWREAIHHGSMPEYWVREENSSRWIGTNLCPVVRTCEGEIV